MCLIVVDVQNDFIDGTLALKNAEAQQDGKEVVPVINGLLRELHFDMVAYSMDWHPKDHCSFVENIACQDVHPNSPVGTPRPSHMQSIQTGACRYWVEHRRVRISFTAFVVLNLLKQGPDHMTSTISITG